MSELTFDISIGTETTTLPAEPGETVLDAIRRQGGLSVSAPCAGRGRCGRCRVILEDPGDAGIPTFRTEEMQSLSDGDRRAGIRLACLLPVSAGMKLRLEVSGAARIETRVEGQEEELDPLLSRVSFILPVGSLEDQRSTAARLEDKLDLEAGSLPARLAGELPAIPDGVTALSVVLEDGKPVAVDPGLDADAPVWAAAADIGTTTVAMYLVNLADGGVVGSAAEMNAQASFGADVISRLEHARKGPDEAVELQRTITCQLENLLSRLAETNGVASRDIHMLAVAGNTAMIHLMAGWDASGLGEAPFLPAVLECLPFDAADIGFRKFSRLRIWPLPSLSAYVGADITGGLLSAGMKNRDSLDLLLDIGTNGEMALGGSDGLLCCSTAAGPAFEGAHLSSGSGSIPGAVDHVDWIDNRFSWSTIDDAPARGFCGSGVVDLVAFLVNSGLMDDTGRIAEALPETGAGADPFAGLEIRQGDSGAELLWPGLDGGTLGFTQKDLREVQLAKAAIRAGIDTLLGHAGKTPTDIGTLWLAGGFGSYIRPGSAAAIGLIPPELADKTRSLGNAAARGALLCLLSRSRRKEARDIANEARAIELSGRPEFQNAYIEAMMFSGSGEN